MTTEKIRDQAATPPDFFKAAQKYLGVKFNLDACASIANTKCERFITKKQNALEQCWPGQHVWCNPPYSNQIPWLEKAIQQSEEDRPGGCWGVCLLLPCDPSTKLFNFAYESLYGHQNTIQQIVLLGPRIQFVAPKGVEYSSNDKPSMLILTGYFPGRSSDKLTYWRWR